MSDAQTMFWCCQSLFKYLPRHDDVYARIAKDLPGAKFVFIEYSDGPRVTELFRERLRRAFGDLSLDYDDYCVFLPKMNSETFSATAAAADVFLDSIGWSGFNSALESTAHNVPIVTWPGELMRGRHSYGILQMMGVDETIAASKEEYVKIAVRLAKDEAYRQSLKDKISVNKQNLYRDQETVRGLEAFIISAVEQAVDRLAGVSST